MTPLARAITDAIALDGPMTVARYMALCLGHPVHGYYATRDPLGAAGDFTTAPEISQMFGELLGLWCAEVWRRMGEPARVTLIELGPGRGTLMADALRAARNVPGFLAALEVTLVETSPALRGIQARTLKDAGVPTSGAATIEDALRDTGHSGSALRSGRDDSPPVLVLANEFFDALPIRQFVRTPSGFRERLVGLGPNGGLAFGLAAEPPSDIALPDRPVGAMVEINSHAERIVAALAAHIAGHGGAALTIDYGGPATAGDTFQAVRGHAYADPLAAPGAADLTAQVDFGALAAAARGQGAAVMALLDQGDLLSRLGVAERAATLRDRATPDQRAALDAAVARLTDPSARGMGRLFKAFAFADSRLGPLPAFGLAGPEGQKP